MSANELKQAVITENEIAFSHNGKDYLLYGWDQCDGYVLSLECEGELVWQSAAEKSLHRGIYQLLSRPITDYSFSGLDSC